MNTIICTQCGIEVRRRAYHVALTANPFCGFACYAAWQKIHRIGVGRKRIVVACYTCKASLEKIPSSVSDRNFCSRTCFGMWRGSDEWTAGNSPSWLGGHSEYRGPNWPQQSRAARARDANTCQGCGRTGIRLSAHHITPFRLFDDYREANRLENLTMLCNPCHAAAETRFWREHPDLVGKCPWYTARRVVACRICGVDFSPRSGRSLICDPCCRGTCQQCGEGFYSRKMTASVVKFCSRACWKASVKDQRIPLRSNSPTT